MDQSKCFTCPACHACETCKNGDLGDPEVRDVMATQIVWSNSDDPENWLPSCYLTKREILDRMEALKEKGSFTCFSYASEKPILTQ